MEHQKRNAFSGSVGFVLAAAGSAVGLGNIWRFPYLAAKDGGGLFLLVYLILALTFGFTLLVTEIAIGRKTKQSPLTAYTKLRPRWGFLGVLASLVPVIILPYYCVIGGWVIRYFLAYLTGEGMQAAEDGYFTSFITAEVSPIVMLAIFLAVVSVVIILGVNKGIENFSKVLMPVLILLVLGIAVFSLTISHTDADGVTRTGLEGFRIYVVPDLSGITLKGFFSVLLDAMGQLFFSLSVAMGIMVTYGSYVKDDANLVRSINQIEIFDTLVAFLAGVMIIPAVFTFMGREGMEASGPSLMFVSLPKVFSAMGGIGNVIGGLFFAMVLFAALTSAISVMEAVVSSLMDKFRWSRLKASLIEMAVALAAGIVVCLGYNKWYFELELPNGAIAQILDVMDYLSNNLFMPLVAIGTCLLVGWLLKPKAVIDEVEKTGDRFGRRGLYVVMVKFIAPVLLVILFLKSVGILTVI
ncbi:sodium-dependent transporter [Acetatifactor aquisgranensis]|uniref:sodium-dependent transporter n=1 Tax=Acetatifactor aquisgranensis TaxID=2941233 RepID=UPI00203D508D|nr:sodium-dependent transporter [Acetatifactor aquisgranensis]MCI8542929.1 sodium-dependent transporter [Lachnospiraceae bacterium]